MRRICPCCDSVDTHELDKKSSRCNNCGHVGRTMVFSPTHSPVPLDLSDRDVVSSGGYMRKRHVGAA